MVHQMAVDRLSHAFVFFLKKYYGLKNAIPQVSQSALVLIVKQNIKMHTIV